MDQSERAEVERLLRSRRKIDAIRFVRQRTGASLVEAKALVESPVEGSDGL
ncbi:MAG: ribosomal protein L7/L12 [Candidatus Limnocylindria bacterium]